MSAPSVSKPKNSRRLKRLIATSWPWVIFAGFLGFALFPVYWIILVAFRPRRHLSITGLIAAHQSYPG